MTRTEFATEFSGIVNLLRDHESLRYSSAGSKVYEEKVKNACGFFADIVSRASGIRVHNPFPEATVDGMPADGPDSGYRAAKRIAARIASAAAKAHDPVLSASALAWRDAVERLAALPRH